MNLRTQSVVQNLQGTVGDVTSFKWSWSNFFWTHEHWGSVVPPRWLSAWKLVLATGTPVSGNPLTWSGWSYQPSSFWPVNKPLKITTDMKRTRK
jgi:hypothetical protein